MKRLFLGSMLAVAIAGAGAVTPMLASAQTASGDNLVQGGLTLPRSHQYQAYQAGRYETVRVESVPERVAQKQMVYDRTAKLWVYHPSLGGVNPMYNTATAAAPSGTQSWQRVHGKVQSVSGDTVTFKADDGRTLTVNASKVSSEIRGALTADEGVTMIGFAGSDATKFTAQYIQQDSSDPARGGTVAGQPAASSTASPSAAVPGTVDEKAWQRIHGTVNSVSGTTLTLKADDGRNLNVDMKEVGEGVRQSLSTGEKVTVIGFYRRDQNNVAARYVQKDSSNK
jgi:preprotein translocase subunit YajC